MSLDSWLVFVAVWFAAGIPLGPSALNCMTAAATNGFARSLWSIVGILLAAFCLMSAALLGVAGLLLAHAEALQLLRLLGAAYLIWLGIGLWRRAGESLPTAPSPMVSPMVSPNASPKVSPVRLVRRAFLVAISNPKAILVYLAVFTQFVGPQEDSAAPALADQLAVLVPTAQAITATIYLGYCAAGSGIGRLLHSPARRRLFDRGVGSLYGLCGLGLATAEG